MFQSSKSNKLSSFSTKYLKLLYNPVLISTISPTSIKSIRCLLCFTISFVSTAYPKLSKNTLLLNAFITFPIIQYFVLTYSFTYIIFLPPYISDSNLTCPSSIIPFKMSSLIIFSFA